jgi:excisionase family DNA binding protein
MPRSLCDLLALTAREASVAGNVRRARIDTAIRDGALPTHKIGPRTLILRSDLEAWIKSHPAALRKLQPNSAPTEGDDNGRT